MNQIFTLFTRIGPWSLKNSVEQGENKIQYYVYFKSLSSVQLRNRVQPFVTPCIAACQASLSITNSRSSPKLMSIESMMPSSHLILCRPLLLLPPVPPSIRVFSNESTLRMRWQKCWSFSFSVIPSKEHTYIYQSCYIYPIRSSFTTF